MTSAPVKHSGEGIHRHLRDVRCWASAGGAERPPFPAVLSGAGGSVERVSAHVGAGSRRSGSSLLLKHLDEVDVVTHDAKKL